MVAYVDTWNGPASAALYGFVPPRLKTKDNGVVLPFVKVLVKALVKVMLLLMTVHPALEDIPPVVDVSVHKGDPGWSVRVIEGGNVIMIWLLFGMSWVGRKVTVYNVVYWMTVVIVGTTVKETMTPGVKFAAGMLKALVN